MNKVMTVGVAALMAAGVASAQSADIVGLPAGGQEPEISAELALYSSYVFRGMVVNNDSVLQPQMTIEHYGVSFNMWGNYNLGTDKDGVSSDLNEVDYTLAYAFPLAIDDLSLSIGMAHYAFPNVTVGGAAAEATTELFVKGTLNTLADLAVPVIPSLTLYGDVDEVNGTYVLFDVRVPYALTEVLSAEGFFTAGYGNTSYNDAYFATGIDAGWTDYSLGGNLTYAVSENLSASLNLTYSMVEGGAIQRGADAKYEADQKVWGGLSVAYDF